MQVGNFSRCSNAHGFTLVELLVVMVVVGILAALVAPMVYQHISPAKHTAVRGQMNNFMTALDNFVIDVGRFPSTDEGLKALRLAPTNVRGWKGPYLRRNIPSDPWGKPYLYRAPAENGPYEISSLGADGQAGGEGDAADIINWEVD